MNTMMTLCRWWSPSRRADIWHLDTVTVTACGKTINYDGGYDGGYRAYFSVAAAVTAGLHVCRSCLAAAAQDRLW